MYLRPEHQKILHESGLSDATIDKAMILTVDDPGVSRQMTGFPVGSGMAFCVLDSQGHKQLFQFRPDNPKVDDKGKARKYVTPLAKPALVYRPPIIDRKRFEDAKETLWITEGAKKALRLAQEGLCCVALAGVDMAGDPSDQEKRRLRDGLAQIALPGRQIIVCFDADIATNENVQGAEKRLLKKLLAAGCMVKVTRWDMSKGKGIDDYLAAGHPLSAVKLEEPEVSALTEKQFRGALKLNDRYCYVQDAGKVYDQQAGLWYTERAFERGNEPYAPTWNSDEFRLDRRTYLTVEFCPTGRVGDHVLNLFQVDRMIAYTGSPLLPEDCPKDVWDLVLNLVDGSVEHANHVLDKIALLRQKPGASMTGTIFQDSGTGGTGKTTLLDLVSAICAPYSQTISHTQLSGNFNSYLAMNIAICIPECKSEEDQRALEHKMREVVLGAAVTINEKFQPERRGHAYAAWWLSSNESTPLTIPAYDRRWEVFRSDRKLDPKIGERIHDEIAKGSDSQMLRQLVNHLLERDLTKLNPMIPVTTQAKTEMVEAAKPALERWWAEVQTEAGVLPAGRISVREAWEKYRGWYERQGGQRQFATQLPAFGRSIPKGWRVQDSSKRRNDFIVPDNGQKVTADLPAEEIVAAAFPVAVAAGDAGANSETLQTGRRITNDPAENVRGMRGQTGDEQILPPSPEPLESKQIQKVAGDAGVILLPKEKEVRMTYVDEIRDSSLDLKALDCYRRPPHPPQPTHDLSGRPLDWDDAAMNAFLEE